jgi:hypothetical protein
VGLFPFNTRKRLFIQHPALFVEKSEPTTQFTIKHLKEAVQTIINPT